MAVTHLPEPHPSDPIVAQLSQMYRAAYDATLADLQLLAGRGLSTRFKAQMLLRLGQRKAELRAQTLTWAYGPADPLTGARRISQAALHRAVAIADRQALTQLAAIGITVEVPAAGAVSASFTLLNDTAVRVVAQNIVISLDKAVTHFDTSVRAIIGRAENDVFRRAGLETVGEKLTEGLTVPQGRARLMNKLTENGISAFTDSRKVDWNLKSYSDMVIRTNTREATSEATLRRVEAEGHDYLISTSHQPTCPLCAKRQGRVYCISGRDPRFPALSTVGNTPWHPNCFPAGVMVSGPPVVAHMARPYDGELVIIRTASGQELPVTPNHPILTPKGWVAAGLLQEGDQVFQHIEGERVMQGINPDDVLVPTPIEDVPSALWEAIGMLASSVPIAPEDFHGDGIGSEVCIIRADGLLRDGVDTVIAQPGGQHPLSVASVLGLSLPGPGSLFQFLDAALPPAHGSVSGSGLLPSTIRGLPDSADSTSFGTGWGGHDPGLSQAGVDGHLCDAHLASYMALGHAGLIESEDLRGVQGQAITTRHMVSPRPQGTETDTSLAEPHLKSPSADADDVGNLFRRLAGSVQLDHVVQVNRIPFSGHVYNLQTVEGWYVANSIITHNCGHSLVPWSEAYEPKLDAIIAHSNAPFDIDPRSTNEVANYTRAQKIKTEQRNKRKLTAALAAPKIDPKEAARLRRLRAAANDRLIDLNKAQRKAIKGWR